MTFSYLFYYMVVIKSIVILNCIHDVRRLLMNEMFKSAVQNIIHNKIISCLLLLINHSHYFNINCFLVIR